MSLAASLKAVVSQRLVRRSDGRGMIAAVEILIGSAAVRDYIAQGDSFSDLRQLIRDGRDQYGMQTFDDSLASLVTSGAIQKQDALEAATSKAELELKLSGVG
jgi:twitching motility protein PilT